MTQELLWIYIFNLIVNSFLVFLTITVVMQLIMFFFRVKQPRFKAILLSIPIVKLAFDPFIYDFQNWALMQQINPLELEMGSRILSLGILCPGSDSCSLATMIRLSVDNGQTFTPADVIAYSIPFFITKGIVLIVGGISVALFGIWLYRLSRSVKAISCLVKKAHSCNRPLKNPLLIRKIQRTKTQLISSPNITIPCAFGIFHARICFPTQLIDRLSQDEFEAIIVHELEHLRWFDGLIRLVCQGICTIFWWIPSRWSFRYMEDSQERACDTRISQFNITRLDLASAIIKTAKMAKRSTSLMISAYFVQNGSILKRIKPLLEVSTSNVKYSKFSWLQLILVGMIVVFIFLGRFWIF